MNRLFFPSRTQSSPSLNNVSCAFTPDMGKLNWVPSSSGDRSYGPEQSAINTQLSGECFCSVLVKLALFV